VLLTLRFPLSLIIGLVIVISNRSLKLLDNQLISRYRQAALLRDFLLNPSGARSPKNAAPCLRPFRLLRWLRCRSLLRPLCSVLRPTVQTAQTQGPRRTNMKGMFQVLSMRVVHMIIVKQILL
jgi:hypothetical protein